MPRIQRHAVLLNNSRVKRALDIVHVLRDQSEIEFFVAVQIVQVAVRVVHAVGERCVRWVGVLRDAEGLPLGDVVVRDGRVVVCVGGVAGEVGDDGHGFDAYNAFEGEVGLVAGMGMVSLCDVGLGGRGGRWTYASAPAKSSVEI